MRTVRRYLSEPVAVGEPSKVLPAESKRIPIAALFVWGEASADKSRRIKLREGDLGNITDCL
jgi:hypothetical protein